MTAKKHPEFIEFPRPLDEEEPAKVIVTTMRFDPEILAALDAQAKKRGVSRTAYVMFAITRAIESGL